jgi:hypothetical protein
MRGEAPRQNDTVHGPRNCSKKLFALAEFEDSSDVGDGNPGIGMG